MRQFFRNKVTRILQNNVKAARSSKDAHAFHGFGTAIFLTGNPFISITRSLFIGGHYTISFNIYSYFREISLQIS